MLSYIGGAAHWAIRAIGTVAFFALLAALAQMGPAGMAAAVVVLLTFGALSALMNRRADATERVRRR